MLLSYLNLSNRKKFYELIKKHFDQGANYEELFSFLMKKMPESIKSNDLLLDDFLAQDNYTDILNLYENAQGDAQSEKLENLFKQTEEKDEKNIKVMSIHKSKGLGAEYVFMVGLNEGIIPNKKQGNDSVESQRRRFYVGITRTKKQLFLYSNVEIEAKYANKVNIGDFKKRHPKSNIFLGRSSSFISELNLN